MADGGWRMVGVEVRVGGGGWSEGVTQGNYVRIVTYALDI